MTTVGKNDVSEAKDNVNHPAHYQGKKIEVIEFLEDQEFDFHRANAVKYIARAGKKNPEAFIEDLEKAVWYLRRAISLHLKEKVRPNDMPQERALAHAGSAT